LTLANGTTAHHAVTGHFGSKTEIDSANQPSFSYTTRRKPMHVTK